MTNPSKLVQSDLNEAEFAYYKWQMIRRNPEYITSYAKYKRNEIPGVKLIEEHGFAKSFLIKPMDPHKIKQEIHYYKKQGTIEGYHGVPETNEVDLSKKEESIYLNLFNPAVQIVTSGYQMLEDNKYVTIKVDITQKFKPVKEKIDLLLNYIWLIRQEKNKDRNHIKKWDQQLKVWDLRGQKKSYSGLQKNYTHITI